MSRRLAPFAATLVALIILAACAGGQTLTDPKEIITQGLAATADLSSLHLNATVSGSFTDSTSGAEISLDGTKASGDFATSGQGHFSFEVPTFLGLAGEVIVLGSDAYVKTTLTGEKWAHQPIPVPSPGASGAGSSGASAWGGLDPKAMALAEIGKLLAKDGVVSKKLDDVDCGDVKCYHVQVTIPKSVVESAEPGSASPMESLTGDVVLDLLFNRDKLWLTEVSTKVTATSGSITAKVTFSKFNEPVTVSPPPSDQVTEGGLNFPGL
ncbi:MAG: hypothetical protein E6J47_06185 [Chloroflexi bacterium]|nr:MAG: hypothetical protein E6J47_06185 [Chloroflexota bacterium]